MCVCVCVEPLLKAAMELKLAQFIGSSCDALSDGILVCRNQFDQFLAELNKHWTIVRCFDQIICDTHNSSLEAHTYRAPIHIYRLTTLLCCRPKAHETLLELSSSPAD